MCNAIHALCTAQQLLTVGLACFYVPQINKQLTTALPHTPVYGDNYFF